MADCLIPSFHHRFTTPTQSTTGDSLMRKIRMGMVGGGEGAFIGEVHRRAAALDGLAEAYRSTAE